MALLFFVVFAYASTSTVDWPILAAAPSSAETHPEGHRMLSIPTTNNSSQGYSKGNSKGNSSNPIDHQNSDTSSCNTSRLCHNGLSSKRVPHLLWGLFQSIPEQQLSQASTGSEDSRREDKEKDKGKEDKEREGRQRGDQIWLGREGKAEADSPFLSLELLLPSARAAGIYFVRRPEGTEEGAEEGDEEGEGEEQHEEEEREDDEAWSQLQHEAAAVSGRASQQHNLYQDNHHPPALPHLHPPQSRSPRHRLSLLKKALSEDDVAPPSRRRQLIMNWLKDAFSEDDNAEATRPRRQLIMNWLKDAWVRSVAFRLNGDPREDRFLVGSQQDQGYHLIPEVGPPRGPIPGGQSTRPGLPVAVDGWGGWTQLAEPFCAELDIGYGCALTPTPVTGDPLDSPPSPSHLPIHPSPPPLPL
ncbi:unnamed protein product [Closterium sp. Yama58-4]|nr:unnamed protein product [Closterium sp. Yama58-4]